MLFSMNKRFKRTSCAQNLKVHVLKFKKKLENSLVERFLNELFIEY